MYDEYGMLHSQWGENIAIVKSYTAKTERQAKLMLESPYKPTWYDLHTLAEDMMRHTLSAYTDLIELGTMGTVTPGCLPSFEVFTQAELAEGMRRMGADQSKAAEWFAECDFGQAETDASLVELLSAGDETSAKLKAVIRSKLAYRRSYCRPWSWPSGDGVLPVPKHLAEISELCHEIDGQVRERYRLAWSSVKLRPITLDAFDVISHKLSAQVGILQASVERLVNCAEVDTRPVDQEQIAEHATRVVEHLRRAVGQIARYHRLASGTMPVPDDAGEGESDVGSAVCTRQQLESTMFKWWITDDRDTRVSVDNGEKKLQTACEDGVEDVLSRVLTARRVRDGSSEHSAFTALRKALLSDSLLDDTRQPFESLTESDSDALYFPSWFVDVHRAMDEAQREGYKSSQESE